MENLETKKVQDIEKTNSKMAEVSPSLLVITLNVNDLNSPNKRDGRMVF